MEFTSNYGIRSTVNCALRAAGMAYYDNSFAYRDGKCYLCRADNVNCAASQTEFRLVGPHYFQGKINIHSVMKLIGHNLVWIPHEEYLLCEDLFSICLYIITTSVTCFSLRHDTFRITDPLCGKSTADSPHKGSLIVMIYPLFSVAVEKGVGNLSHHDVHATVTNEINFFQIKFVNPTGSASRPMDATTFSKLKSNGKRLRTRANWWEATLLHGRLGMNTLLLGRTCKHISVMSHTAVREITKSSSTFSATNISSNIV